MTGKAFLPTGLTRPFGTPANTPHPPTRIHKHSDDDTHTAFLLTKEEHDKKMAYMSVRDEDVQTGEWFAGGYWSALCEDDAAVTLTLIYSHGPLSCLAGGARTSKCIACIGKNNKMTNLNTSLCQYVTQSFCFSLPLLLYRPTVAPYISVNN